MCNLFLILTDVLAKAIHYITFGFNVKHQKLLPLACERMTYRCTNAGFELAIFGFVDRRVIHCATKPPLPSLTFCTHSSDAPKFD
ncbi:hypothetical protein L596_016540 [Steinernema carpocapsae]|uniref:Uncharacterized protein n=1 Tax=Steinernema carpocapsae TaxID=34508 RepID=A0A4U5NJ13_STECR|nr:hypothetical protein L596_016540 [Steinernema carpocapsae]